MQPNNSTLEVFAQMVQQEKQARKLYLSKFKTATQKEKQDALDEMKRIEQHVDTMLYAILNPLPGKQATLSASSKWR